MKEELFSTPTGWELVAIDGVRRFFDSDGKLLRVEDRNGVGVSLTYATGVLSSVDDDFGNGIVLSYAGGALAAVSLMGTPHTWSYGYDAPWAARIGHASRWRDTHLRLR